MPIAVAHFRVVIHLLECAVVNRMFSIMPSWKLKLFLLPFVLCLFNNYATFPGSWVITFKSRKFSDTLHSSQVVQDLIKIDIQPPAVSGRNYLRILIALWECFHYYSVSYMIHTIFQYIRHQVNLKFCMYIYIH